MKNKLAAKFLLRRRGIVLGISEESYDGNAKKALKAIDPSAVLMTRDDTPRHSEW